MGKKRRIVSEQTRNNLILDSLMGLGGILSALSGVYFLFLPVGGYQGGRNPLHGVTVLFERHTWSEIHTWASVALIGIAALHIPLHWSWILNMSKRGARLLFGDCQLNKYSQFNLGVNILIGLSGLVTAFSGLYFLLVPGASHESLLTDPGWLFTRLTWDLIHTWSGVVFISAMVLHIWIHWKWFYKVALRYGVVWRKRMSGPVLEGGSTEVASVPVEDR
ncbi:MAG: DUF4405 domain-containing protein [Anaerolineales bacterium]